MRPHSFPNRPHSDLLGQLARAAFKTDDLPSEWDTDELDGKTVIATIKLKDTGYNSIVPDTIQAVKAKQKPETKPAKTTVDEADTWSEDEDRSEENPSEHQSLMRNSYD